MPIKDAWKRKDIEEIEKEIAKSLRNKIKNRSWQKDENLFQDYCIGALEFIFYPNFIKPKKEDRIHNGRKELILHI